MALKTSLVIAGDSASAVAALDDLERGLDRTGAASAEMSKSVQAGGRAVVDSMQRGEAAVGDLGRTLVGTSGAAGQLSTATDGISASLNRYGAGTVAAGEATQALQSAKLKLFAAEEQLEAALGRLALAQQKAADAADNDAVAQQELGVAIAQAQSSAASAQIRVTKAQKELADATDGSAKAANRQQYAIRNAGQQVGDFGLQVATGQDPARAFSQQIGQLGYAMSEMGGKAGAVGAFLTGPWGIALTIAAAVAAPFIEKLIEGGEKADEMASKLVTAANAADSFGTAQSLVGKVIDLTTGKMKTLNVVMVEYIKLAAQANIVAAQKQQREASDALKGKGQLGVVEVAPGVVAGIAALTSGADRTGEKALGVLHKLAAQSDALKPLKSALDDYATAINRIDLSRLSSLKPGELDGVAAKVGTLTSGAIAQLDKLGASGKLAGRDLIETKKSVLDLGKAVQDQIANQLAIDAADGKGVSALLKPYEKPKKERKRKGPSQAALDAEALGISDRIAGIEDQYAELPTTIKKANDQLRELGKIKADINKQPLLPGAEALKARIEALEPTIKNSLNKPFNDYLKQQRQSAEIERLQIQGRDDEATALQEVLKLQKEQQPLSEQQINAVLETVKAERERALVLRDQRALIQGNIAAVQSFRGALEQTVANALRGRFSLGNILASIGNNAINIASQRIVEQIFGNTLRSLESQARGSDRVETAAASIANSLGKGSSAVESFGTSLDNAATTIRNAAARIDGKPTPVAANDNAGVTTSGGTGPSANDNGGPDIIVTAPIRRGLAGQGAVEQIFSLVDGALRAIGIRTPPIIGDVIKGSLGRLEKSLPSVLAGAAGGATASRIILGDRGSAGTIGSSIGGAIGQKVGEKFLTTGLSTISKGLGSFAGPIGSVVGGLLGGLVGGLFAKQKFATSTITSATGKAVTVGNDGESQKTAASLSGAVQSGIAKIADQLGGVLDSFKVSIGTYKDGFRVNTIGYGGSLKHVQGETYGFDTAEAAISFAIADAIKDGGVKGLSAAVQAALQSSTDVDAALKEALNVSSLETALGGVGAQLAKEVQAFQKTADERLRLAKAYGLDLVKVEQLNAKDRLALNQKLLRDQVGSLQDLVDEITSGSLFEGSAVDKRTALLDQIAAVRGDANAGVDGAADKLAKLLEQLNTVSKDAFGTTGAFAADQQSILDSAREAIANANKRVADAQKGSDPALAETNAQLNESNDQLAKISSQIGDSVAYLKSIAANNDTLDLSGLRLRAAY